MAMVGLLLDCHDLLLDPLLPTDIVETNFIGSESLYTLSDIVEVVHVAYGQAR
jgi:hypothetical protein